jgi:hypothetical protein
MAKSYTKQLSEWVGQARHSARRDRHRVAFMAVKNDVKEALEEGWPMKTIWAHMVEQKRIGFGYDTFLAYVKRHVKGTTEPSSASKSSRRPDQSLAPKARPSSLTRDEATQGRPEQASHGPEPISGFTFNAAPNREELI